MRLTRAAQRAQDVTDDTPDATDIKERAPLNEISPNESPEHGHHEVVDVVPKKAAAKSKRKGGAKKGKGKKGKAVEEEEHVDAVIEEVDSAQIVEPTAATEEAADVIEVVVQEAPAPAHEEAPASPPSKPVRLTRRQLALQEEELKQSQHAAETAQELEIPKDNVAEVEKQQDKSVHTEQPNNDDHVEDETVQAEEKPSALAVEEPSYITPAVEEPTDSTAPVVVEPTVTTPSVVEEATVHIAPTVEEPKIPQDAVVTVPAPVAEETETSAIRSIETEPVSEETQQDADAPMPSVEITSEAEPKSLGSEKPIDDVLTPIKSHTPSRMASRSPSKSPMRIEESIESMDALEEALENVGSVARQPLFEERSPRKKPLAEVTRTPSTRAKKTSKLTTPAPTRLSKAPSAEPRSIKPTRTSLARASSVRAAPSKDAKKEPGDIADYLATKRKPISMSFPTPPPPPKGRAPTRPTFQLSSTAVAERLKLEKEERLKRQAEGVTKKARPISMPPPPKSTKPPTKPNFELPGEKIAAELKAKREERLKREAERPSSQQATASSSRPLSMSLVAKSTKAPTKPNFSLPGSAVAEKLRAQKEERLKRQEEAEAAKKAAAAAKPRPTRAPVTVPIRQPHQRPGVTIPPPSQTLQPQRSTSLTSKRTSLNISRSTSTSSTNRATSLTKSTVTPVDAAQQKLKGREVFNRDKVEKEAAERERKSKEEAAKRARAEAAERGRIASREWAEKQRKKLMGGAA